jgi:hypothetical protein
MIIRIAPNEKTISQFRSREFGTGLIRFLSLIPAMRDANFFAVIQIEGEIA